MANVYQTVPHTTLVLSICGVMLATLGIVLSRPTHLAHHLEVAQQLEHTSAALRPTKNIWFGQVNAFAQHQFGHTSAVMKSQVPLNGQSRPQAVANFGPVVQSLAFAAAAALAVLCHQFLQLWPKSSFSNAESENAALLTVAAEKPLEISDAADMESPMKTTQQRFEEAFFQELEVQGERSGLKRELWVKLQSPARYLGNELGAFHKPWDSADVRMVVAYPEVYEVGISNLGHVVLYTLINRQDGLLCDRSYMPLPDLADILEKENKPLFAVESQRPLGDFHAVALSLAYELGAVNCIQMLHLAQIPKTWKERLDLDRDGPFDPTRGSPPLVFAGGPTATSNPEPFADFFDFFALGDGEECLPEIGQCLRQCKEAGLNREDTLFKLATEVKGIYVPMFYDCAPGFGGAVFPIREGVPERILRRVATPDPTAQFGLQPYLETVHDRLTVEIRRGCTRGCRFCQPGMLTRPARDVDPEKVVQAVEEGVRKFGYNEFSLLSLSCSDYLSLPAVGLEIKNRLKKENVTLSLPSQRVDRFDENIANIIGGVKKGSLTFAPEAGTQRMRDIINKGLTNEELLRGVKTAFLKGWAQVKLYFMIGLPGETDADVLGIVDTVKWLQSECTDNYRRLKVNLTVSNFTPKPHTPFQWHSVSSSEFQRKQAMLREAFRACPPGSVKVNYTAYRISAMEDFIGRGDRRLCPVMLKAWEHGAHKDVWWEGTDEAFQAWDKAIEESGMTWKYRLVEDGEWDVLDHLGDARYRGQGAGGKGRLDRGAMQEERLNRPLPWDHINTGISKSWLKTQLQRALEGITVPDCSYNPCSECGVCGEDFGENVIIPPPPIPEFDGRYEKDTRKTQKLRITFGKLGSMACIGHLDTLRVLDRAFRRAALPLSIYNSNFNARPRISCAVTLPLGWTSETEIYEVVLTESLPPAEVQDRLNSAMPSGMPVLSIEEIPLFHETGAAQDSLGDIVTSQEFLVQVGPAPLQSVPTDDELSLEVQEATVTQDMDMAIDYQKLVEQVLAIPSLLVTKETKKNPDRQLDIRAQVLEMQCVSEADLLPRYGFDLPLEPGTAVLRVRGTAIQTGAPPGILNTPHLLRLLQEGSGTQQAFRVVHAHRIAIMCRDMEELPDEVLKKYRALQRRKDWKNLEPTVTELNDGSFHFVYAYE